MAQSTTHPALAGDRMLAEHNTMLRRIEGEGTKIEQL
jgi:hypothetical protein